MIFNVPIHLTFNGLYFDLLNCLADSDFHHCPSHQIMNSEAAYSSVSLEDAASHLCSEIKFPSPFNSQSTTSSSAMWKAANQLNLPCIYECPWIALTMVLQKKKMIMPGSRQKHESQVMAHLGSVTPSLFALSVTQADFLTYFPWAHCRIHFAIFLVALFKSKKKTTRRFLKSHMWLRKPQVGMQPL